MLSKTVENDHNLPNSQTQLFNLKKILMLRMTIIYLTLKQNRGLLFGSMVENDHNLPNSQTFPRYNRINRALRMTIIYLTLKQFIVVVSLFLC